MATAELDTCFMEDETIEGVIQRVEAGYPGIKGTVVNPRGPAGGWPVVRWEGEKDALSTMISMVYGPDAPSGAVQQ